MEICKERVWKICVFCCSEAYIIIWLLIVWLKPVVRYLFSSLSLVS
jgi:hypothetical protein